MAACGQAEVAPLDLRAAARDGLVELDHVPGAAAVAEVRPAGDEAAGRCRARRADLGQVVARPVAAGAAQVGTAATAWVEDEEGHPAQVAQGSPVVVAAEQADQARPEPGGGTRRVGPAGGAVVEVAPGAGVRAEVADRFELGPVEGGRVGRVASAAPHRAGPDAEGAPRPAAVARARQ
jgi:hypothetical protein